MVFYKFEIRLKLMNDHIFILGSSWPWDLLIRAWHLEVIKVGFSVATLFSNAETIVPFLIMLYLRQSVAVNREALFFLLIVYSFLLMLQSK